VCLRPSRVRSTHHTRKQPEEAARNSSWLNTDLIDCVYLCTVCPNDAEKHRDATLSLSWEDQMAIGHRVRQLREQKGLSQGDVERVSGMLRTYISRVENGHRVPSLDTLGRFATALNVPLYQLFCEAEGSTRKPNVTPRNSTREESGAEDLFLQELKGLATRMAESDRTLLLDFASCLANR